MTRKNMRTPKRWIIWTIKPWSGDRCDPIAEYRNHGQALARLRGLTRAAWKAGSEMQYMIHRG